VLLSAPAAAQELDELQRSIIVESVSQVFDDVSISRISATALPGIYEVQLGTEILYVTADGRFALRGDLLDLEQRRNLSEDRRAELRATALRKVPATDLIEFAAPRERHRIYVFTDVNCGYCQRMHRDMPELHRRGISVRYLAFPVIGNARVAYRDMEAVWCADDRQEALTRAKAGGRVEPRRCASPVNRQYELGRSFGIQGTPAIYLENGRGLPGYLTPQQMMQYLEP